MSCREFENLLQDYIDGYLPGSQERMVDDHRRACPDCARRLETSLAVVHALKGVEVPPPSPGFAARAVASAVDASHSPARRTRWKYHAAIAASLLIAIVVSMHFGSIYEPGNRTILLPGGEVRIIRIAIESEHAVDNVTMTIDVSDNLELVGYEGLKEISWQTGLNKGTNIVSLPVLAISQGDGTITARIGLGERQSLLSVKTRSAADDEARRLPVGNRNA